MARQTVTYEQVMASLRKGEYKPVYLLMGEEDYFIDSIADYIKENALTEDEKTFDLSILYGKDIDCNQLIMAAKRYPMMAKRQVIIVREAQNIRDIANISLYMKQPQPSTILVLCYKHSTADMRKKFVADIEKAGVVFVSKRLYDNQIPQWISRYAESLGLKIEPKAANMISEFLGTDLSKIANEIGKLPIILKERGTNLITADIVEDNIGISKEYNNFELINAIIRRDIVKSNRIIDHFARDPKNNPLVVTTSVLFNFFSNLMLYLWLIKNARMDDEHLAAELKINKYFINDYRNAAKQFDSGRTLQAIGILRDMDARSKGFGTGPSANDRDILREAIFKILHL